MEKKYFPKGEKVVYETWRIQRGLSGSDVYLETSEGYVRNFLLCNYLNYSKASVSVAIRGLVAEGYVIKDEHGYVELTVEGKKIAKKVYARHLLLEEFLELIGVSLETANHDACRMEHTISEESFQKIQELVKKIKKENASNEQMQLTN